MEQPQWLARAWSDLGTTEAGGTAANPRIAAFFRDAGHPGITSDEVAWCAAFIGACLSRSAIKATGSLLARSYLDWGVGIDAPRVGAVAVLERGSDPGAGHVGFVVGWAEQTLFLLGGNQSNRVSVDRFPMAKLLGLRWPSDPRTSGEKAAPTGEKRFETALAHVLRMEGGWSEDPHDPGGPTNQGVTIGVYAAWRGITLDATNYAGLKDELKRISPEDVRTIYGNRYYVPARCAELPAGLGLMHFDAAVNHGVAGAARMLQEALGVDIDGEIGPLTLAAATGHGERDAIGRYAAIRRARYRALPHFWRFGRGWLARVEKSISAAEEAIGINPSSTGNQGKDAPPMQTEQTTTNLPKWWGQSMTIWGALITALATVLPTLGPVIGLDITGEMVRVAGGQVVGAVQAIVGLIGTILTIVGRVRATQPVERRDVMFRF